MRKIDNYIIFCFVIFINLLKKDPCTLVGRPTYKLKLLNFYL